jgi:hypothetical protein
MSSFDGASTVAYHLIRNNNYEIHAFVAYWYINLLSDLFQVNEVIYRKE